MPDDVEDPELLARAEAATTQEGAGESGAPAWPRWTIWTCGLLVVASLILVAKGLTEDRPLSMVNVSGVYDYQPSAGEMAELGRQGAAWPEGVMTLSPRGKAIIECSGPDPWTPGETRQCTTRCSWRIDGDVLVLYDGTSSGRDADIPSQANGWAWVLEIKGNGIELHAVHAGSTWRVGADGEVVSFSVAPGRYVLRTEN